MRISPEHLRRFLDLFHKCSEVGMGEKVDSDQFRFLGNCPPTLPLVNINTYFSLRAKWWLKGGVGGKVTRNLNP